MSSPQFVSLHNGCMSVRCWSFMITRTALEVLLGLSILLQRNLAKRYVANLNGSELPAYILEVDSGENVYYVAKMSYCVNE
jgi:hypothetical protein